MRCARLLTMAAPLYQRFLSPEEQRLPAPPKLMKLSDIPLNLDAPSLLEQEAALVSFAPGTGDQSGKEEGQGQGGKAWKYASPEARAQSETLLLDALRIQRGEGANSLSSSIESEEEAEQLVRHLWSLLARRCETEAAARMKRKQHAVTTRLQVNPPSSMPCS